MAEAFIPLSKLPLNCPVCMDQLFQPRSLPCLHTLCTTCLQSHIDVSYQNNKFMTSFQCPVCRAVTSAPKRGLRPKTWAEHFPLNHVLLSLIDEAVELDQPSVSSENTEFLCDQHDGFTIRLFCEDHQIMCCPMCVATEHRKCNKVKQIEDLISDVDIETERISTSEALVALKPQLTEDAAITSEEAANMTNDYEKAKRTIQNVTSEAINHLRHLQDKALDEFEERHDDVMNGILDRDQRNGHAQDMYQYAVSTLDDIQGREQSVETFIRLGRAKEAVTGIKDLIDANVYNTEPVPRLIFEVNESIKGIREYETVGSLLEFTEDVSGDHAVSPGDDDVIHFVSTEAVAFTAHKNSGVPKISKIPPSLFPLNKAPGLQFVGHLCEDRTSQTRPESRDGSRGTWITATVEMSPGILVACNHTDKSLQVFRNLGEMYSCEVPSAPMSLAKLSDTHFAVTFPYESLIRIYDLRNSAGIRMLLGRTKFSKELLKQEKEIPTKAPCYGICLMNNRLVAACEGCLKVFAMKGYCIQTVTGSEHKSQCFTRAAGLAVDNFRSTVYVTDEGRNVVVALKVHENFIENRPAFIYTSKHLKLPRGVVVSGKGKVLVCGFGSKNIHILNPGGRCLQILRCKEGPWSISINDNLSQLILTFVQGGGGIKHTPSSSVYRMI